MRNHKLIFSPCPAITHALSKYHQHTFPLYTIPDTDAPLHESDFLSYLVSCRNLGWSEALSYANKMYYTGESNSLPDIDGTLYLVPSMYAEWQPYISDWINEKRQVVNCAHQDTAHHPTSVHHFNSRKEELDFVLQHPDAFVFSTDVSFMQQLYWARGKDNPYAHWRLSEKTLYHPDLITLSFQERLERIAPAKDIIYHTLQFFPDEHLPKMISDLMNVLFQLEFNWLECFFTPQTVLLPRFTEHPDLQCNAIYTNSADCHPIDSTLPNKITAGQFLRYINCGASKRSIYPLAIKVLNNELILEEIGNYFEYTETARIVNTLEPYLQSISTSGVFECNIHKIYKNHDLEIHYTLHRKYHDGTALCFCSKEKGEFIQWLSQEQNLIICNSQGLNAPKKKCYEAEINQYLAHLKIVQERLRK